LTRQGFFWIEALLEALTSRKKERILRTHQREKINGFLSENG